MSKRFDQLDARRRELLRRTSEQRQELTYAARDVAVRTERIDRGIQALRTLARNPLVVLGAAGVLALVGPRRLLRWGANSAFLLTTAQRLLRAPRPRLR